MHTLLVYVCTTASMGIDAFSYLDLPFIVIIAIIHQSSIKSLKGIM